MCGWLPKLANADETGPLYPEISPCTSEENSCKPEGVEHTYKEIFDKYCEWTSAHDLPGICP
tara:strand:- start:495 stop:680 length:186 start_codon:yes stop_codon:yes gene_type:complete